MRKEHKVLKIDEQTRKNISPKKMDEAGMRSDLSFRLADRILLDMADKGMISETELHQLRAENMNSFSPFLTEIMS